MRRFAPIRVLIAAVLLSVATDSAIAQNAGALLLQFPVSARIRAMGDNGAADNSDPANIYFNPANIVAAPRAYLQGSRWDFDLSDFDIDSDIWIGSGNAGITHVTSGGTTLAADLTYGRLDYGENMVYSDVGEPLGEFDAHEQSLALTLGLGLTVGESNELRIGAAVKRWWAKYPPSEFAPQQEESTPDAIAFDTGVTLALRRSYSSWNVVPALGVAIVNAGSDIEFDDIDEEAPLPTRIHFGANVIVESPPVRVLGGDMPLFAFACNVDGTEPFHDEDFIWGMGTELAVAQVLFLRNGFYSHPDEDEDNFGGISDDGSGWGVGLGIPAGSFRFRFDYGHTSQISVPDIYGVSLVWRM